jgi:hypothetical protein
MGAVFLSEIFSELRNLHMAAAYLNIHNCKHNVYVLYWVCCKIILSVKITYKMEVFTAVAIKNAVFWDIKPQFVPHRKHITSPCYTSQLVNAM